MPAWTSARASPSRSLREMEVGTYGARTFPTGASSRLTWCWRRSARSAMSNGWMAPGLAAGFWGVACDAGCRAFDIRGVVTNRVFVAGDIARSPHVLFEYQFLVMEQWNNAVHGAEVAAHNMVCEETDRRAHIPTPANWSGQFHVNIKSVGVPSFGDEIIFTQGSPKDRRFAAAYGHRGRIVGAVTFDHAKWLDYYGALIERSAPFPPSRAGFDVPADARPVPAEFPPRGVPTATPDVVLTGHDSSERQAEFRPRARAQAAEATKK